jgi:site-specific recombinase XerD
MASLMYGAGLRLMECLRLRVQDVDFSRNEILVPDGKGAGDRAVGTSTKGGVVRAIIYPFPGNIDSNGPSWPLRT